MAGDVEMMRSVQRILAIFECFTPTKSSRKLQEIADRIQLPKSTAFRIIRSLELAGYLVRLEDQRYCLSFRFTRLAGLVKSTLDIRTIARAVMIELSEITKETVGLYTLNGRNRVCIEALGGASVSLRSVLHPGEHLPIQLLGSASKTLMAHVPATALAPMVAAAARASKRTQADLYAELARIREQGYGVSHGERLPGLSAISAPIWDVNEEARYCLTVNGPSFRIQKQEKEFVKLVVKGAADISRQYGGNGVGSVEKPAASRRRETSDDES